MNKKLATNGFITMIVVMIAIVIAIAVIAFKRISDANNDDPQTEARYSQQINTAS